MVANQKLTKSGVEVLLFPLSYMYISQGENGSYSHLGTLNIDFLGWGVNGRILECPYYAPCSMKCVSRSSTLAIWESDNPVYLVDGSVDYITLLVVHDNNPPPVNKHVNQGDILGYTGVSGNVTGDHVHMGLAKGKYAGWVQVPPENNSQLKNSISIYKGCFINDTIIISDYNYMWFTYDEGEIGSFTVKKSRFNFILYNRKKRERTLRRR